MKFLFLFLFICIKGFNQESISDSILNSYTGKRISTFEKSKIYNDLQIDNRSIGFYKIGLYNKVGYYKDNQLIAYIIFYKPFKKVKGNIILKKIRIRRKKIKHLIIDLPD